MNLQFVKIIPKPEREIKSLSIEEKFIQLKRETEARTKQPLKKFHFQLIEHDSKLILLNGNGSQLLEVENSIKGEREARNFAVELFTEAKDENRNGGYKFK